MKIEKVMGIENEYGIQLRVPRNLSKTQREIVRSSVPTGDLLANLVVRAYRKLGEGVTSTWDPDSETPERDLRGFSAKRGSHGGDHFDGDVLENGGRYYVDSGHPEYSSPECSNPLEAVIFDKAGERIVNACRNHVQQEFAGTGASIQIVKNNTDFKGNSYGCHENMFLARRVAFEDVVACYAPFFASRQVLTGAGKIGHEPDQPAAVYQISQRADFIEQVFSLETMNHRPIINTRDEPHANREKYRRLHIILGDSNMSEYCTFLKIGSFALVTQLLEDGVLLNMPFELLDPVKAVKIFSRDLTLSKKVQTRGGRSFSALDLQEWYLEKAERHLLDLEPAYDLVLKVWREAVDDLRADPRHPRQARRIDWLTKLEIIEAKMERQGKPFGAPRNESELADLQVIDLLYGEVDPAKSAYYKHKERGMIDSLIDNEQQILDATNEPPETTRAYFRGRCVKKYHPFSAKWDSVAFEIKYTHCKKCGEVYPEKELAECTCGSTDVVHGVHPFRVPMEEPLRGTADKVKELIDSSDTPWVLLNKFNREPLRLVD